MITLVIVMVVPGCGFNGAALARVVKLAANAGCGSARAERHNRAIRDTMRFKMMLLHDDGF